MEQAKIKVSVPLTERERKYKDKYGEEALRRMKALDARLV